MLVRYAFPMDHIGLLLPKVLKKRGLDGQAKAALVTLKAQEWISEHLPDYKHDLLAQRFKDGVVIISCVHSIASQECRQRSGDLLLYLQEACKGVNIEQVRLIRVERNT